MLTDFSGNYTDANGKGSLLAAELAVQDFGGSVMGKPIEVIYADHQNKPDVGNSIAREWFDRRGVDIVVDLQNSAVALTVSKLAAEKKRIAIVVGAATSRITNEDCNPFTIHYAYDTYALANVAAREIVAQGGKKWFFVTADYSFGQSLEQDAANIVKTSGGEVKGSVRHPLNTSDFSSFLLQAQGSKADVIGLANAGADLVNSIKTAKEFQVTSTHRVAGLLVTLSEVHSLGLEQAQGILMTDGWYWDMNDQTRAFSKRFFEKIKRMPNMFQAGVYSATLNYLAAIKTVKTDNSDAVMKEMKRAKINDLFAKDGYIRRDGRMIHDMYLVQVKKPSESRYPWDYYNIKAVVKGDDAFQPLAKSRCSMVSQ